MNANDLTGFDPTTFDIEDSADVIGLAKSLVNGKHPGILSTVGVDGKPQVRWMSTLSFDDFPVFYTLTSPTSGKVEEIRLRPSVNWMFFNADLRLVLNLHGEARIVDEVAELKKTWKKIEDMSHAYFLNQNTRKLGFVAIETTVESISIASPKFNFRVRIGPMQLAAGCR